MKHSTKMHLVGWTLAACTAAAGVAFSATTGMSKDAFKLAQQRIEAQLKVDSKACGRFKGNAKDVCEAQAKGREQVAKAELDARYKPGPEAERVAKSAQADADYDVAKVRCDSARDKAKDTCLQKAKNARDAADRQAMIEKVKTVSARKARVEEQRTGGKPAETPEARYAALKARCVMRGEERDSCLADVQRRFHKS
jgi:hypothetical protein